MGRFEYARDKFFAEKKQIIGNLSEKTMHGILKNFFADEEFQEKRIGKYYADVLISNRIIEIQTKDLYRLNEKLDFFLKDYQVIVAHPIIEKKELVVIDESTLVPIRRRKSPRIGTIFSAFRELYGIKKHLKNPNLIIEIILIDAIEFRTPSNSFYHKSGRIYDVLPTCINREIYLNGKEDYKLLLEGVPNQFTTLDISKILNIRLRDAQMTLNILYYLGAIRRIGKKGNAYIYERT